MSPLQLAFIAVIAASLDGIVWKYTIDRKGCPWATLIIFHIIAVFLITPFVSMSDLTDISWQGGLILFLSCITWVVGDLYSVKAYEYLDAAVCEVYGTLKLVLVATAGILLFSEKITVVTLIGMGLIIASVAYQLDLKKLKWNKGMAFKAVSIIFHSVALITDKFLTNLMAEETIVFYGFLVPAIIYSGAGYKYLGNIKSSIVKSNYVFLISPFLGVTAYYFLIQALALGDLSVTYMIQETAIIFIFILEVVLLKANEDFVRKAMSCVFCALGAVLVCAA